MRPEYEELLRSAINKYLECLTKSSLEPAVDHLDFNFSFLENRKWYALAEEMIRCEIRELTNNINQWSASLYRWHAWNNVLTSYEFDAAWTLRSEFLDATVHECLLNPFSMRDTFVAIATNAAHQIRLSSEQDYRDIIDGDQLKPDSPLKHFTRRQKEARLQKIVAKWQSAAPFLSSLRGLDDASNRENTSNYRNLNTHTIGPRLGFGQTRTITRSVAQAIKLVETCNGRYTDTLVPDKMQVSYSFGGTEPLDLETARVENLQQFHVARDCYEKYRVLLENAVSLIPSFKTDA